MQKPCHEKMPEDVSTREDREQAEKQRSACLRRCGLLLESRDYSVFRLREKLLKAGFPECIVEEALGKLGEAGYLDDHRYAREYIRIHLSDKSCLRIRKDLSDRGIADEVIEEAFEDFEEEDVESAQIRQIRRLLEKRRAVPAVSSYHEEQEDQERARENGREKYLEEQKTLAFLQRKGFSHRLIRRALEEAEEVE